MERFRFHNKRIFSVIFPLVLVLLLPLFVWTAMNFRTERRGKAASGEVPTTNTVVWTTDSASLTASNFYIKTDNVYFTSTKQNATVHSDPGNNRYKTLEITWYEFSASQAKNVEMRMNIYFKSDGVYWWSDEIRTYNGKDPGDWIYYKPVSADKPFFKTLVGRPFRSTRFALSSNPIGAGTIEFENVTVNPFFKAYCFTNLKETGGPIMYANGTSLSSDENDVYKSWVVDGRPVLPGCEPCVPFPSISCKPGMMCATLQSEAIAPRYYCPPRITPKPLPTGGCYTPPPPCTGSNCPLYSPPAPGLVRCTPTPQPPMGTCTGQNGSTCETTYCPPCPEGMMCTMVCYNRQGTCQNGKCYISSPTPIDTCPRLTPPRTGCHILQPRCIQGPCCPIVICDTPSPTPKPTIVTPTPTPPHPTSCTGRGNGTVCSLPICLQGCSIGGFGGTTSNCFTSCSYRDGVCTNGSCVQSTINPTPTPTPNIIPNCSNLSGITALTLGETATYQALFTSPQGNLKGEIFYDPGNKSINAINTSSLAGNSGTINTQWRPPNAGTYQVCCRAWNDGIAECRPAAYVDGPPRYACTGPDAKCLTVLVRTPSITPTPTPTAGAPHQNQTFDFFFKFAGVTDNRAEGAKISVRIVTPTTDMTAGTYAAKYTQNGIYQITFALQSPLDPSQMYRFILKGEKHLARKVCNANQTAICRDTDWFKIGGYPLGLGFHLNELMLEPGDTYQQDGIANTADFNRVFALMGKSSSQLTVQDKLIGDLDYNGVVNALDVYLMRKTLENRYDEN
jgi:hypothetical protein